MYSEKFEIKGGHIASKDPGLYLIWGCKLWHLVPISATLQVTWRQGPHKVVYVPFSKPKKETMETNTNSYIIACTFIIVLLIINLFPSKVYV